jgi:hypothetical protein
LKALVERVMVGQTHPSPEPIVPESGIALTKLPIFVHSVQLMP